MSMVQEFKEFALKGNMLDLAIGLNMGTSFGNVVNSFVSGLVVPCIKGLTSGDVNAALAPLDYGVVFGSLLSFAMLSAVTFVWVKAINSMKRGEEPAPVEKECPHCYFSVPIRATRCGHCTSMLYEDSMPETATVAL